MLWFFQRDFVLCSKRLIDTFYDEFTNWQAVYAVIEMRLTEHIFTTEMFHLLKIVIKRIKSNDNSESLLRSYAHTAIRFLRTLDRQYVMFHDNIIYTILDADEKLMLTDDV